MSNREVDHIPRELVHSLQMDAREILRLESASLTKKPGRFRVCLVYPNEYEVGIANLGFQILYGLLNAIDGVSCERSFLDTDSTRSLETRSSLSQFHLLAFSLPYELDFLNVLAILKDSRIPLRAADRSGFPLLLLGGIAATANPLPYSEVFDLIYLGEAEAHLKEFITHIQFPLDRTAVQDLAEQTPGFWLPGSTSRPRRVWVENLNDLDSCAPIVTPLSHFSRLLLCDLERGCPFECRFCLARQAYSPYRARDVDVVLREIVSSGLGSSGVGLMGAALCDVSGLGRLIAGIRREGIAPIGISSLRLDRIDPSILDDLVASGLRTISIAPEAGTERLRWIINKRISDEKILSMGSVLDRAGVKRVRLYFMVGLPYEEESEVAGIVHLVTEFRRIYGGRLVVSVNPFVPKAHTPFQYHGMESRQSLAQKISSVKKGLRRLPGTRVISKSPREALVQGILSLGDCSVGSLLVETTIRGAGRQIIFRAAEEAASTFLGQKAPGKDLPWDFIDFGVSRETLMESYSEARALVTPD